MTDRKRDPLPEGYQFGDAARRELMDGGAIVARTFWRDIEQRHVVGNRVVAAKGWRERTAELDAAAGLPPWPGWNVIEGAEN